VNIEFIDLPEQLREKYQYYTCADISRLLSTGWPGPQYSLDRAVRDYVGRYLVPRVPLQPDLKTTLIR